MFIRLYVPCILLNIWNISTWNIKQVNRDDKCDNRSAAISCINSQSLPFIELLLYAGTVPSVWPAFSYYIHTTIIPGRCSYCLHFTDERIEAESQHTCARHWPYYYPCIILFHLPAALGTTPRTRLSTRGSQTFSAKGQIVNILGFVGHMISVTTSPCRFCSTRSSQRQNVNKLSVKFYDSIKPYLQTQATG